MRNENSDDRFKPITPTEAAKKKIEAIPVFVIGAINDMLIESANNGYCVFNIKDIVESVYSAARDREKNPGGFLAYGQVSREEIRKWITYDSMNSVYGPYGWKISTDYPGYNESYDATMTFSKK